MATLITVHGTFATGPVAGETWWQFGSPFTARLATYLEADQGFITHDPFVWDGLNSENSRRAAGRALAEKMAGLESRGEPYAIVGHSHGGSVVSAALLDAARSQSTLPNLRRWITIGTPFIKTERQRNLFLRIGVFGKAIYLTLLTFMILVALASGVGADKREAPEWLIAAICAFGPMTIFYAAMSVRLTRHAMGPGSPPPTFAAQVFADRWLSLWHAKDEAVQSLKAVKSLDVEIFPRDFAAAALNLLAIAIIPILSLVILTSEPVMDILASQVFARLDALSDDDIYKAGGTNIFENAAVVFLWLIVVPASVVIAPAAIGKMSDLTLLTLLAVSVVILIAIAVLLTWVFNRLAGLASHGLSLALNPLTVSQLKAVAYGSDVQEDLAVDAAEWPIWLSRGYPPLPDWIAGDIETASDRAIGDVIPKFRNIIESLTEADSKQATADVLADYLTWKELIHTSYFEHDRFAKLLAYAIGQSAGFRPSPALLADSEFPAVVQAYDAIVKSAIERPPA